MNAFFDTSAIVPLVFREPHSAMARKAWDDSALRLAWNWLRVEADAALLRRKGDTEAWNLWRTVAGDIHWIAPEEEWIEHLRTFNRGAGLRAADAGHLYVMERCAAAIPDLVLVTFDVEMLQIARQRGINLFNPSSGNDSMTHPGSTTPT